MASSENIDLSRKIKDYALSIGFDLIGIASSKELEYHKKVLNRWLSSGMNAKLGFLSNKIDERTNPALLVDRAKSVIVAGINYFPPEQQGDEGIPVISKYAYGKDYHIVVSDKLDELFKFIISCEPAASGKICVDTAAILEKAWAYEAGLGSIGKNSLLINNIIGSFIFLGEIILNIDLQYDKPFSDDLCQNCTLCLEACPTKAINGDRTIDVRKCISWLTVENKDPIPEEFVNKLNNRIFGCDTCQDVCPWNKKIKPHNNADFALPGKLKQLTLKDWKNLTRDEFYTLFERSSIRRRTYERFMKNVTFVTNSGN
jgi:epoxyqueuosine reductase